MADPVTVLLVRHGQTRANGPGLDVPMSGWTDLTLSAAGAHQARNAAQELARGPRVSAVYSSPLRRARSTAEAVAAACGVAVKLGMGLSEIDCGQADGLRLRDVQRRFPEAWTRNLQQADPDFAWPGGETYREFRHRVLQAMRNIVSSHAGERIVVVTHAGVISQLLGSTAGLSPARWEPYRPRNGSVTELRWQHDRMRLVRFDQLPSAAHPAL